MHRPIFMVCSGYELTDRVYHPEALRCVLAGITLTAPTLNIQC